MNTAKNQLEFINAWKAELKVFYRLYDNLETKEEQATFLQGYEKMMEAIFISAKNAFPIPTKCGECEDYSCDHQEINPETGAIESIR